MCVGTCLLGSWKASLGQPLAAAQLQHAPWLFVCTRVTASGFYTPKVMLEIRQALKGALNQPLGFNGDQ